MNRFRHTATRWLGTLFSLPFAATGLTVLFLMVMPMVYDWARMKSWVPVQAELLEVGSGNNGSSYLATARYRYRFNGFDHEGRRVAVVDRADNIGDFHQRLAHALQRSLANGMPVTAWVNPGAPQDAVLDRSLRIPLLLFHMMFVLAFGGFGIGFIWFLWRRPGPVLVPPGTEGEPWLARREWVDNRIRSDKRMEVYVAWGMAIFWNLLCAPIVYLHDHRMLDNPPPGLVIAMLFPIAGVGVLAWAIRATLEWRRHGDLRLQLDPFPGSIGGHVGGSLTLRTRHDPQHRYKVVLSCIEHWRDRTGNDTDWQERLLWQTDGLAQTAWAAEGTRLSFRFDVPGDLPASSDPDEDGSHHGWRVELDSTEGTPRFSRRFAIPVFATGSRARLITQDSEHQPTVQAQRRAAVEELAQITRRGDALELYFGPARQAGLSIGWSVVGLIFSGAGVGARMMGAPVFFFIIFCFFGVLITGAGLWGLGNSLRVHIDRHGLRTERRFLGFVVNRRSAHRRDIRHLALDVGYRSRQGARHETIYRVVAKLDDGGQIVVADTLRGQPVAEAMMERIARDSGLQHAPA
ncbi:DUF3592 domain-containing protein [Uliginosibacterium sp. H1]|uniref:DUF3592 domain-containing protein n=1 Tax=Uliginosibacterium sp. H1 TaxID=3114757 RepID=UPI002E1987AD|nr:DUF3592 domain-containing protein [Uliginosibacterium sp. H1]